ncbi:major facilitator superfamily domain-containing protein [Infundibulicybe gibba]|nr:major facilitator superfamily domain-containing protein [Infundibulicybe gibba]
MPESFPEGGWRAWSVVFGVWLIQFCTFGYTNAYGVYNDFYVREYLSLKYTSSQISWIGSVQLLLVMSAGLLSGRGFDAGYFYHLIIGGATLFVFCLFMLSISQAGQYYQGSAVGGAIQPIMLNSWFHGSLGFHQGVRASAAFNAALLIIAICLVRPRLPPKPGGGSPFRSLRIFIVDVPYMIMVSGTVFFIAGAFFPIFFLQLKAVVNGIKPDLAFYMLAVLNVASVFGRIVPTLFVHRFGIFNAIIPCTAAVGCAGTFVFAVLYGFFSGAYVGLLAPMVASISKQDEVGARLGICFFFAGSPIAGALLSPSFIWWRPVLFSGLCVSAGALSFGITRIFVARRKQTQWI